MGSPVKYLTQQCIIYWFKKRHLSDVDRDASSATACLQYFWKLHFFSLHSDIVLLSLPSPEVVDSIQKNRIYSLSFPSEPCYPSSPKCGLEKGPAINWITDYVFQDKTMDQLPKSTFQEILLQRKSSFSTEKTVKMVLIRSINCILASPLLWFSYTISISALSRGSVGSVSHRHSRRLVWKRWRTTPGVCWTSCPFPRAVDKKSKLLPQCRMKEEGLHRLDDYTCQQGGWGLPDKPDLPLDIRISLAKDNLKPILSELSFKEDALIITRFIM